MEILAIIPARGGSKGVPRKNILDLNGHPLIAYSIACAIQSDLVNRVVCSTDSNEIANIAINYGAETPFIRPPEISNDVSTDLDVFTHALNWLADQESYMPDLVVQLRPTSPLRTVEMIKNGVDLILSDEKTSSIRAVSYPDHTPYKMWNIDMNGYLDPLLTIQGNSEPYNTQRQLLPMVYAQTGTLEIIKPSTILEGKSMTGDNIKPLIIDNKYFVDIDTIESFILAGILLKKLDCIIP